MDLTKRTWIGNPWKREGDKVKIVIENHPEIKVDRISTINEEVIRWRKANQIHRWFVENVQAGEDDCKDYYVREDQLQNLLNLCKQVEENHELAKDLLPGQEGFFFGSTEYDEYYFEDIRFTREKLELLLNEPNPTEMNIIYYYSSSW